MEAFANRLTVTEALANTLFRSFICSTGKWSVLFMICCVK